MRAPNPRLGHLHARTQRVMDRAETLQASARAAMARIPGPLLFLDQRRWARGLGTPLPNGAFHDTPVHAARTLLVFPDGRTLGFVLTPFGLSLRKGLVWPQRARAYLPQLTEHITTWTNAIVAWDTLEQLPHTNSAHTRLARRNTHDATSQIAQATHLSGVAHIVHPLWAADVAWTIGGDITTRLYPTRTNPDTPTPHRLETSWNGEDLAQIAADFAHHHPTLDRFERNLGWMIFGRWCGWPLSRTPDTPIWVGVTPTGGNA